MTEDNVPNRQEPTAAEPQATGSTGSSAGPAPSAGSSYGAGSTGSSAGPARQAGPAPGAGSGWQGSWAGGGVTWTTWTWSSRRTGFSWFGALLVLVGIALVLHEVEPRLDSGSLVTIALGLVFAGAYLARRWNVAIWPATVLVFLGIEQMLAGLGYFPSQGWDAVALGLGLMAAWLVERIAGARHGWALALAALFLVLGALQLVQEQSFGVIEGYAGPAILVGVGVVLVVSSLVDRRLRR